MTHRALLTTALIILGATAHLRADDGQAVVAESAPIEALFERARQGIGRGDWKLAVDSLQRIIDDPQGALITQDGRVYESARMQAYRLLDTLPSAGTDAYHLIYDAEAKTLYQKALDNYDLLKMQRVIDHYLLTEHGRRAAITLAGWLIDSSKPVPAITILADLMNLQSLKLESETMASAMLAVAYAQLGRSTEAKEQLDLLRHMDSLPQEWPLRLKQIESFLKASATLAQSDDLRDRTSPVGIGTSPVATGWPTFNGGGTRAGRMPATVPSLLEGLPWRYSINPVGARLPLRSLPTWRAVVQRQLEKNTLLTSQMVIDGDHLLIKANDHIIAMDLLTFEVAWTSKSPVSATLRSLNRSSRLNPWRSADSIRDDQSEEKQLWTALNDHVSAQLSIAHGLIFDLRREWGSNALGNRGIPRALRGWQGSNPPRRTRNQLFARDLADEGKIVWSIGPDSKPTHPLAQAIFASTPVEVADELLVSYWEGEDFYAAFLNPDDGSLIKSIYLCTTGADDPNIPAVLPPAVDDQFAYFPTNSGMLLALNVGDHSLRWATVYSRNETGPAHAGLTIFLPGTPSAQERDQRDYWLAGPPVISGSTILLAPPDADALYAFNRATGKLLWHKDREDHTYIVAADSVHTWLGGRHLTMVDLSTGHTVWSIKTDSATGRAVLSGERLLVPTTSGLLSIVAQTGKLINFQPLPAEDAPLGNLLCWAGALYSLDTGQIRKFPDLEQSYEPAQRLHAADPTNPSAAIRLAWMELLKKQPEKVLATLEAVVHADTPKGRRQREHIAHLQVEALLASIRLGDMQPDESLQRLRRACEVALRAEDRFKATLALGEHLGRNHNTQEAYQRLWRLAHSDEMVSRTRVSSLIEISPEWKRSMRDILVDRLSQLKKSLSETEARAVAAELASATSLDSVSTRQNRKRLRKKWDRLAEGDDLEQWNQLAALRLGRMAIERRKYERAEYYLRRAVNLDLRPTVTAGALIELARIYLRTDQPAAYLAVPHVQRLERHFADLLIDDQPVAQIVRNLDGQLQTSLQAVRRRFKPQHGTANSESLAVTFAPGRMLHYQKQGLRMRNDVIVSLSLPNRLAARRASDRKILWPSTPLRLPSESSLDQGALRAAPPTTRPLRARLDGQTLLVNTETALHAVGLITGRRLWSIPIDVPLPKEQHVADDALFDVGQGRVAVRINAHQLDLVRLVDGRDVLWRAQLPTHVIGSVQMVKDRVVVIDDHNLSAIVFDLRTGQKIFESTFSSPADDLATKILLFEDVLCGWEGEDTSVEDTSVQALAGYRLSDGRRVWTQSVEVQATSFFKAKDKYAVVGGSDGQLVVLDPRHGRILHQDQLGFAPLGIYSGHLQGETLYLLGLGEHKPTAGESGGREIQLAAVDLNKRETLWTNLNLGGLFCNAGSLGALAETIPMLYQISISARSNDFQFDTAVLDTGVLDGNHGFGLVFVDKSTGELSEDSVPFDFEDHMVQPTGDLDFWPHRVLFGTNDGVKLLETRAEESAPDPSGSNPVPTGSNLSRQDPS